MTSATTRLGGLLEPAQLSSMSLRNRFAMAPMTRGKSQFSFLRMFDARL